MSATPPVWWLTVVAADVSSARYICKCRFNTRRETRSKCGSTTSAVFMLAVHSNHLLSVQYSFCSIRVGTLYDGSFHEQHKNTPPVRARLLGDLRHLTHGQDAWVKERLHVVAGPYGSELQSDLITVHTHSNTDAVKVPFDVLESCYTRDVVDVQQPVITLLLSSIATADSVFPYSAFCVAGTSEPICETIALWSVCVTQTANRSSSSPLAKRPTRMGSLA